MTIQVDINSDIGEGVGDDEAMLSVATSVNVACGFHAGDTGTMRRIATQARARGVGIGAHPGYHDLAGFGRKPMPGLSASEIENLVAYQIGALCAVASLAGHKVTHVKAHGALSNAACSDAMIANAIAAAVKAVDPNLAFMVLPQTELARAADRTALKPIHEIYADRAYQDDAQLLPRSRSGAVLHDANEIARRVLRMVTEQSIIAASGKIIPTPVDSVCVHGDTPGAVEIAKAVRAALEQGGVKISPFSSRP
ncbi:MAG: LamB/YcsF family protein [Afipia felis]|nr:LamB/YcsF family protein [Afipia felis]